MIVRVAIFYVLTFVTVFVLGGLQQITQITPEIGLPQLAPGIAALLMLVIYRKDRHQLTFREANTPLRRYLVALLIPAAAGLIAFGFSLLTVPSFTGPSLGTAPLLPILIWMPIGAIGEEIGWRGYLHKHLDGRLSGLVSSLITGTLWTFFHVHFLGNGIVFLLFTVILFISISTLMYIVVYDQQFSILLASIFHIGINLTSLLFIAYINSVSFMVVYSLSWALMAAVVLWMRRETFLAARS
jgi:membrane protease YdiL (CAAX protease family)